MNNFWKKYLSDGTFELGSDVMIKEKIASWSSGRQDIISTEISFGENILEVNTSSVNTKLSKWEQYDNFIFSASMGRSIMLSRTLKCSLDGYSFFYIKKSSQSKTIVFLDNVKGDPIPKNKNFLICSIKEDGSIVYQWS
jgi:hypothetical protein